MERPSGTPSACRSWPSPSRRFSSTWPPSTAAAGGRLLIGVPLTLVLALLALIFLLLASVCVLNVVQDTANGYEKVQNWPDLNFMDWVMDAFFVINSLWFSSLPGILLGQLVFVVGAPVWAIFLLAGLSMFGLFPLTLLSMVTEGSSAGFVSLAIWRSVRALPQLWKRFYLVSTGLAAMGLVALPFALVGGFLLGLLAALMLVAAMLIYARLLGRLRWAISEASAQPEGEEAAVTHNGADDSSSPGQ